MDKHNRAITIVRKKACEALIFLTQKLISVYKFISHNDEIENKFLFDDLTPVADADKDKKYEASLLWALKNKNIKNIALTGPYGSGKSSVLRTFEINHKEFNFLNISLGTFSISQSDDSESSQIAHIEKSILQQIFYKVKKEAIPYSRFNRIKNVKFTTYLFKASFLAIWVLSIIYIDDPYKEIFHSLLTGQSYYTQYYYLVFVLFSIFGLITIINQIFQHFSHSKLNKISLTSGEIEFEDVVSDSILNRHLDEILYFFEKTKFDVVVIEDLDRFEKIDIFIKLREINSLINNSDQINRKIVFIYAIKDDVFKDTNRTKFFDFIIPVIPIINSSNSGEIFLKKLSQTSHAIPASFIRVLTLYVDDMRMLKNIYNEFVIYKENLSIEGKSDLKLDKLLGLIVYKNKYPCEFALLNENKGPVAGVFERKSLIVNDLILDINNEIEEMKLNLKEIESEKNTNIKDLRRIYVSAVYEKLQNCSALYISGVAYLPIQLVEDEAFRLLKNQTSFNYYIFGGSGTQASSLSFRDVESFVMPQLSYDEREAIIKQKLNGEVDELKRKIKERDENIRDIKSLSLKSLVEQFPEADFFDEKIREQKLLVYLLRNGYIDEMYHTFISYFYEGTITRDDRAYILSVNDKEPLSHEHALGNIGEILDQLKAVDFKTEAILNFSLLDFLLVESKYQKYLDLFFNNLTNGGATSLKFIDAYLGHENNQSALLFKKISKSYIEFWVQIINKGDHPSGRIDFYFQGLFENSELTDFINMNVGESISNYITTKNNFFEFSSEFHDQKKLQNLINELSIHFSDIESPESNLELFKFIVENDLYEINHKMIDLIITTLNLLENSTYSTLNYTSILNTKNETLIRNIQNNIDKFISDVLLKYENYVESESSFLALLNNESINEDLIKELLIKADCVITNLSDVDDADRRKQILNYSKVRPTWSNVLTHFIEGKELDEALITFLNDPDVYTEISQEKLKSTEKGKFDDKLIQSLTLAIITSTELGDESYSHIVKAMYWIYESSSNYTSLSEFKVKTLIVNYRMPLSEEMFSWMQKTYPALLPILIEYSVSKYMESIEKYTLDTAGITHVMNSQKFSRNQKLKIINNLDLGTLTLTNELVSLIYNIITSEEAALEIPQLVFDELLKQNKSVNEKLRLLTTQLDFLNKEALREKLLIIGSPLSDIFKNNKQPKLSKSLSSSKLAIRLESFGLISSYSSNEKDIKLIPKRKK